MKNRIEHQYNIACGILDSRKNGYSIQAYFDEGMPVIIYGFSMLATFVYEEIKNRTNVLFFLDRGRNGDCYENVNVFSLENVEMHRIIANYHEIILINTIIDDDEQIHSEIDKHIKNIRYVSLYSILSYCKANYNNSFRKEQNQKTINVLCSTLSGNKPIFNKIVLLGTSYSLLIALLYFADYSECLFIFERFVSPLIVTEMKKSGLMVLAEPISSYYYDITYYLADVSKTWNIPIYGHDHLNISKAFLDEGITVFEDGSANYDIKDSVRYKTFLDCGEEYFPFGYDHLVRKVILTGQFDIPRDLSDKVELVSLLTLWNKKTIEEKQRVLSLMSVSYDKLVSECNCGRDILFLTEYDVKNADKEGLEKRIQQYKEIADCKMKLHT